MKFNLTTVDCREKQREELIEEIVLMTNGQKEFELKKSNEEAVELMKAIMRFNKVVSNVNFA